MYFYDEHKYLVELLQVYDSMEDDRKPVRSRIKDVEHWRLWLCKPTYPFQDCSTDKDCSTDVSVLVLEDGSCYIGMAKLNPIDVYNHKIGYGLSLKRALIEAVRGQDFKNRRSRCG